MELKDRLDFFKNKGFIYNSETGNIISPKNKIIKGKNSSGYIICSVSINKKIVSVTAHRLAWYLYYNEITLLEIDHIDRNKTNNKIDNLRLVTSQENKFNSNSKGYYYNKNNKKYRSVITLSKKIHLGYFDTPEEAHQAYLEAKKKYHIIKEV